MNRRATARKGTPDLDEVNRLRGELHATQAALALVIATLAGASRSPRDALETFVRKLEEDIPMVLATLEASGATHLAAGYERGIEIVAAITRSIELLPRERPGS